MTTLASVIAFCEQLSVNVADGNGDALDALAELRAVMGAADDAMKVVGPLAVQQAERYPEKTFEHHGLTFQRTDGKRAFKYDHLKPWADAKKALAEIEERAKNAALQMEKKMVLASDDGEVYEPAIITYGKPSISIVKQ